MLHWAPCYTPTHLWGRINYSTYIYLWRMFLNRWALICYTKSEEHWFFFNFQVLRTLLGFATTLFQPEWLSSSANTCAENYFSLMDLAWSHSFPPFPPCCSEQQLFQNTETGVNSWRRALNLYFMFCRSTPEWLSYLDYQRFLTCIPSIRQNTYHTGGNRGVFKGLWFHLRYILALNPLKMHLHLSPYPEQHHGWRCIKIISLHPQSLVKRQKTNSGSNVELFVRNVNRNTAMSLF